MVINVLMQSSIISFWCWYKWWIFNSSYFTTIAFLLTQQIELNWAMNSHCFITAYIIRFMFFSYHKYLFRTKVRLLNHRRMEIDEAKWNMKKKTAIHKVQCVCRTRKLFGSTSCAKEKFIAFFSTQSQFSMSSRLAMIKIFKKLSFIHRTYFMSLLNFIKRCFK